MDGWIYLHRKLLSSEVFNNDQLLKLFIWCLLRATEDEKWVPMMTGRGTTQVKLSPGQLIFSRNSASIMLGMPERSLRDRMQRLVDMGTISINHATHYSVVTITKWGEYQTVAYDNTPTKRQAKNEITISQSDGWKSTDDFSRQPSATQTPGNRQATLGLEPVFDSLKKNPAYREIDIDLEYHKMCAWCKANRKIPSHRRFVNWLNHSERPLKIIPKEVKQEPLACPMCKKPYLVNVFGAPQADCVCFKSNKGG